jgi:hypothetical protein
MYARRETDKKELGSDFTTDIHNYSHHFKFNLHTFVLITIYNIPPIIT